MLDERIISRLEKTISKTDLKQLQDVVVFQEEDGSYNLFNTYSVTKSKYGYTVTSARMIQDIEFSALKNAVTWCTFDKRNRYNDANRIQDLDSKIQRIDSDIELRNGLAKKTNDTEYKLIYLAKVGEDKLKRKSMLDEMNSYIAESRVWQNKRFNAKPKH